MIVFRKIITHRFLFLFFLLFFQVFQSISASKHPQLKYISAVSLHLTDTVQYNSCSLVGKVRVKKLHKIDGKVRKHTIQNFHSFQTFKFILMVVTFCFSGGDFLTTKKWLLRMTPIPITFFFCNLLNQMSWALRNCTFVISTQNGGSWYLPRNKRSIVLFCR